MSALSPPLRRATTICHSCRLSTQIRHASLLRRPKRPYTFTQMITLSDGSTYLHRTTSPQPIYRTTKDTKNNSLWNPSSQKLANVEEDEAGRLKRFRGKYGRGWDGEVAENEDGEASTAGKEAREDRSGEDSLMDLISGYSQQAAKKSEAAASSPEKAKSGKK